MGKFFPLELGLKHVKRLLLLEVERILAGLGLNMLIEVPSNSCHKLADLVGLKVNCGCTVHIDLLSQGFNFKIGLPLSLNKNLF